MIFETPVLREQELVALERIEALRRDLRYFVAEPRRWSGSVRRVLGALAIQGSNSIEGHNVSLDDAVAAVQGDEPTDAEDEDWSAVAGYRRAMTYVLQLARDPHFAFSQETIRSLHFIMTEYALAEASPGLWRPGPIYVHNEATGEIVYEGPDEERIPALIDELIVGLNADQDTPSMVRGAMAHLNLVAIHPFRDGNGRMSRCLQTLVLARDQILAPEYSSIEEFLGHNTQPYYQMLRQVGGRTWTPSNDARPWLRFCLEAHFIQATSVLRRVRESETMWRELQTLSETHGLQERTMAALFDATIGLKVRNSSYRATLKAWDEEISNQVATTDLKKMVGAGLLLQIGAKRGTYYERSRQLLEILLRVRADRTPIVAGALFDLAA
jgi:Fic family protein